MGKPNTIGDVLLRLVIEESGCITWPATKDRGGYGHVRFEGKTRKVHRVVYEHFRGPIAEGLTIDHLCRNRACANPWHLEPVTSRVNSLRSGNSAAKNAAKTHCKRGHPLSGDNLYVNPKGQRQCKACRRMLHQCYYYSDPERTRARNRRKYEKSAARRTGRVPKLYCAHGHPRVPENLYPGGSCRTCVLQRSRDRYYRAKGQQ